MKWTPVDEKGSKRSTDRVRLSAKKSMNGGGRVEVTKKRRKEGKKG